MAGLVFITGASSGIGQALAWRYYQAGFSLALVARRTPDLEAWVKSQGILQERCSVYGADVSHIDSIVAAGQLCLQRQGVPDVVIANAGISVGMDTGERGGRGEDPAERCPHHRGVSGGACFGHGRTFCR